MAADDGTTAAGWELPGTEVRLRRVGETVVLEPIVAPAVEDSRADPSWPPGYWEWLDAARARGEFDHDDIEPFDFQFLDLNLDDMP